MDQQKDWDDVTARVVKLTRKSKVEGFVALYLWGSVASGETDAWSDLDVCLVHDVAGDDAADAARDWMFDVLDAFEYKVDPTAVPLAALGRAADWKYASYAWGLTYGARRLLGADIRARIAPPKEANLRLCALNLAFLSLRRVYGLPREKPFPARPEQPDPRCAFPTPWHGNFAWQNVTAVQHMLRAIQYFESGVLCLAKPELLARLRALGEEEMASAGEAAMRVRRTLPRVAPLAKVPPALAHLIEAVPAVHARLRKSMARLGLRDPSYTPRRGGRRQRSET